MWGAPELTITFLLLCGDDDLAGMKSKLNPDHSAGAGEPGAYESVATVAHEFFHVWTVKRLRPIEFGPGLHSTCKTRAACGSPKASRILRPLMRARGHWERRGSCVEQAQTQKH